MFLILLRSAKIRVYPWVGISPFAVAFGLSAGVTEVWGGKRPGEDQCFAHGTAFRGALRKSSRGVTEVTAIVYLAIYNYASRIERRGRQ